MQEAYNFSASFGGEYKLVGFAIATDDKDYWCNVETVFPSVNNSVLKMYLEDPISPNPKDGEPMKCAGSKFKSAATQYMDPDSTSACACKVASDTAGRERYCTNDNSPTKTDWPENLEFYACGLATFQKDGEEPQPPVRMCVGMGRLEFFEGQSGYNWWVSIPRQSNVINKYDIKPYCNPSPPYSNNKLQYCPGRCTD